MGVSKKYSTYPSGKPLILLAKSFHMFSFYELRGMGSEYVELFLESARFKEALIHKAVSCIHHLHSLSSGGEPRRGGVV